MALSFRNSSDRGYAGLDIDGGYLAAVVASDGRIERAESVDLPEGLVRDGEVVDAEGLTAVLKDFMSTRKLPKRVRLGVSNQQIVVRVVDLPVIEDRKDREQAVRFQAAEAIAMPLDEAVLDHQVAGYGVGPDGTPKMRVVVVAARRSMIEPFVSSVRAAGLKADGIDLDAFALVRMLPGADTPDESARVLCHLGGVTNLAVTVGNACLFTRPLSVPWDAEGSASRLANEIRLSIDYYMTQPDAKPVSDIVISGPGSKDEDLALALADHVGLPVVVAEPLRGLDSSAMAAEDDPRRYTVAAGLALGATA